MLLWVLLYPRYFFTWSWKCAPRVWFRIGVFFHFFILALPPSISLPSTEKVFPYSFKFVFVTKYLFLKLQKKNPKREIDMTQEKPNYSIEQIICLLEVSSRIYTVSNSERTRGLKWVWFKFSGRIFFELRKCFPENCQAPFLEKFSTILQMKNWE